MYHAKKFKDLKICQRIKQIRLVYVKNKNGFTTKSRKERVNPLQVNWPCQAYRFSTSRNGLGIVLPMLPNSMHTFALIIRVKTKLKNLFFNHTTTQC